LHESYIRTRTRTHTHTQYYSAIQNRGTADRNRRTKSTWLLDTRDSTHLARERLEPQSTVTVGPSDGDDEEDGRGRRREMRAREREAERESEEERVDSETEEG
jgi:hypothetical protein